MINDIFHWFSTDLSSGNTGDLALVDGTTRGQQRVLRRLLTNPAAANAPADYLWHPDYGGGLARFIGRGIDEAKITAVIRAQLALEDVVAKTPLPTIVIAALPNDTTGFSVAISYNDADSNTPVVLSFNVSA